MMNLRDNLAIILFKKYFIRFFIKIKIIFKENFIEQWSNGYISLLFHIFLANFSLKKSRNPNNAGQSHGSVPLYFYTTN